MNRRGKPGEVSGLAALPEPIRLLLDLGLSYLRWLSLTPMVVVWAFFLFMVLFFNYVNIEDSLDSFWHRLERGYENYRERFGPIAWVEESQRDHEAARLTPQDESTAREVTHFDLSDLMPWIMKIWALIALVAWLFSLLRSLIFGPRSPRTLGQKLRITIIAVLVGWVLLFVAYFFGRSSYQGSFFGWFALFTGSAMIVFMVSTLVLAVAEVLNAFREFVATGRTDLHQRARGQ